MGQAHGALGTSPSAAGRGGRWQREAAQGHGGLIPFSLRRRAPPPPASQPPRAAAGRRCRSRASGPSGAPWGLAGGVGGGSLLEGGLPGSSPLGSRTCRTECRSRTASGRVAARTGRGGERGAAPARCSRGGASGIHGPRAEAPRGENSSGAAQHPQGLPNFTAAHPREEQGGRAVAQHAELAWTQPAPTTGTAELPNCARGAQLPPGAGMRAEACVPSRGCSSPKPNPGDKSQGGYRAAPGLPARL